MLLRKKIIAALGKKLRAKDRESAEIDSIHVADAEEALVKLVINMSLVPKTEQTAHYVAMFLVLKFMRAVTFTGWTVKSLDSACSELLALIKNYTTETLRATSEDTPSRCPASATRSRWVRRCMTRSRVVTSSCEAGFTAAGSSRYSPRSPSAPSPANTSLLVCSTRRRGSCGGIGCIRKTRRSCTTTRKTATSPRHQRGALDHRRQGRARPR